MSRRIGYVRPANEREAARQRAVLQQAGVGPDDTFEDDPTLRDRPSTPGRARALPCR